VKLWREFLIDNSNITFDVNNVMIPNVVFADPLGDVKWDSGSTRDIEENEKAWGIGEMKLRSDLDESIGTD
jgi:hypothetical protein